MADDRIQRPNLPYTTPRYDEQNEAAFRREMMTLYAEVDAALLRLGQTLAESVPAHASSHESGGSDEIVVVEAMISDLGAYLDETAADALYSQLGHTHVEADITDLDHFTEADGNAFWSQLGHTHTESDITDLGSYAVVGHTHTESDITDLGTYLTEAAADALYSVLAHTHTESDITDLGSYAVVGHTHTESDITDLGTYLTEAAADALYEPLGTTHSLNTLDDVSITLLNTGDILVWDGVGLVWEEKSLAAAGIAASSHTHPASDIVSGTLGDARVAQSNVTQHQAALSITESQISDLGTYEDALGNPASDGYVLSSTAAGVRSWVAGGGGGVTDHGALTGLGDDDHTQYILASGTRSFTGTVTFDGTQDIEISTGAVPKIKSTGYLQLDVPTGGSAFYFTQDNGSSEAALLDENGLRWGGSGSQRIPTSDDVETYGWTSRALIGQTVTSNTTLAANPRFGFNDIPVGNYYFEAMILHNCSVAGDGKVAVGFSGGTASGNWDYDYDNPNGVWYAMNGTSTVTLAGAAAERYLMIFGYFSVTVAADLRFYFAQQTSSANASTLLAGSWVRLKKLSSNIQTLS